MYLKTAAVIFVLIGMVFGGVMALDARYISGAAHEPVHTTLASGIESMSYNFLKSQIREIRKLLQSEPDQEYRDYLLSDLRDLIDQLCYDYPDDRECRNRG